MDYTTAFVVFFFIGVFIITRLLKANETLNRVLWIAKHNDYLKGKQ